MHVLNALPVVKIFLLESRQRVGVAMGTGKSQKKFEALDRFLPENV